MNKYPRHASELADLTEACRKFVLPGSVPPAPAFDKNTPVWTIGSCFAVNIAEALKSQGINCANAEVSENLNAPPLLRLYLEGIKTGKSDYVPQEEIAAMRPLIASAGAAVLTLGLAVAALDKRGKIAVNTEGEFKAISADEAQRDIAKSVFALRAINPRITVVLTLSPVPLNRSFWSDAPVVADCVSKSTLRVAIDQYLKTKPTNVHYWPAFEIVRWLGSHRPGHYAADDGLERHVSKDVVNVVTSLFIENFFRS